MILEQVQAAAAIPQSALIWLAVGAVAILTEIIFGRKIDSMFSMPFSTAVAANVLAGSLLAAMYLTQPVLVDIPTAVAEHYEREYGIELELGDVRELAKQVDTDKTAELDTDTGGRILFKVVDGQVIPHIEEPPGSGWVPAPAL